MNDAQTWTILVGLLTATTAMFGFMWRLVTQTIDARFNSIDHKFDGIGARFDSIDHKFEAIDHRFDSIDHKFEAIDHRFDSIDHKFDGLGFKIDDLGRRTSVLEDDVRAITRHLFNGPEAA